MPDETSLSEVTPLFTSLGHVDRLRLSSRGVKPRRFSIFFPAPFPADRTVDLPLSSDGRAGRRNLDAAPSRYFARRRETGARDDDPVEVGRPSSGAGGRRTAPPTVERYRSQVLRSGSMGHAADRRGAVKKMDGESRQRSRRRVNSLVHPVNRCRSVAARDPSTQRRITIVSWRRFDGDFVLIQNEADLGVIQRV